MCMPYFVYTDILFLHAVPNDVKPWVFSLPLHLFHAHLVLIGGGGDGCAAFFHFPIVIFTSMLRLVEWYPQK